MTIDEYLQNVTPAQKAEFRRVEKIVTQVVPGIEETISYGVPTFKHKGKYLLYCGAFKNHMSIFPASDEMIASVGEELAAFRTSKGTLQYTEAKPIPDAMLKAIVEYSLARVLNTVKD